MVNITGKPLPNAGSIKQKMHINWDAPFFSSEDHFDYIDYFEEFCEDGEFHICNQKYEKVCNSGFKFWKVT